MARLQALAILVLAPALWVGPSLESGGLPGAHGRTRSEAISAWSTVGRVGLDLSALSQRPERDLPYGDDLLARRGLPVDALVALPGISIVGLPRGVALGLWLWLALAGIGAGRLGARLWEGRLGGNTPEAAAAGLAAGLAYQGGGLLLSLAGDGAWQILAGAALLPWALLVLAPLIEGPDPPWPRAMVAGVIVALLGLTWAPLLLPLGACLLVGIGAGLRTRRQLAALLLVGAVGLLLALVPLAWMGQAAWLRPGAQGEPLSVAAGSLGLAELAGQRPLLLPGLALVLPGLAGAAFAVRRRRPLLALVGVGLGAGLALATRLPASWPDPSHPLLALPGRIGLFAADSGILVELCLALLAGGLALLPRHPALRAALALAPLGLMLAAAPLPTSPWPPGGGGFGLPEGPLVWIPTPGGPDDPHAEALIDQSWHGRPLIAGGGPLGGGLEEDPMSARLYRRWPVLDQLAHLGDEAEPEPISPESIGLLAETGAVAVVVDLDALAAAGARGQRIRDRLLPYLAPEPLSGRYLVSPLDPAASVSGHPQDGP